MASYPTSRATVVADEQKPVEDSYRPADRYEPLAKWVVERVDAWRLWRDSQYSATWDEYERLWRGIWSSNERLRESERSRIVHPALSEAVENAAAEIEEATFGRGTDYFDISPYNTPLSSEDEAAEGEGMHQMPDGSMMPDAQMGPAGMTDPRQGPAGGLDPQMAMPPGMLGGPKRVETEDSVAKAVRRTIEKVRTNLKEDLGRTDFAANVSVCILTAAVFGLGIGEIVTKTITVKTPAMPQASSEKLDLGALRPVSVRNFVYDPTSTTVDDGLGVAIEENTPLHTLRMAQRDGLYRKEVPVVAGEADPRLSGDQVAGTGSADTSNTAHVIRYFGLVPRKLLEAPKANEKVVELYPRDPATAAPSDVEDGDYVEAIVVVVNKCGVLKAESNPYMMTDRPIVLFRWDVVPGRLQGRGICEKGVNPQKILDAEVRARLDSLGQVYAPMMGMDANRMPRGFTFKVKPGASILTNGNPKDVLAPFKFGELDPNHWPNLQACEAMVAKATGSVDATALASNIGDARSGAVSMSLAPVIKRYKRTMVHFLDTFLMPALEKITYRNMQTMPERYPTAALKFKASSTMGIMQREYETAQGTALLQVLEPGSAEHRAVLTGLVSNMTLPNREQVLEIIASGEQRERIALAMQAMQNADPQAQQLKDVSIQLEIRKKQAEIMDLESKARLNDAKAKEVGQTAEMEAMQLATKGLYGLPAEQQAAEFDRRYKLAQLAMKQADIDEKRADRASNERITAAQMRQAHMGTVIKTRADLAKAQMNAQAKRSKPAAAE